MNRLVIFALLISAIGTHAESAAPPDSPRGHVPPPPAGLDRALANAIAENGVLTAGVGVIDDGNLVWTGYYGEQEPSVPASEKTRFNVASITKTVTAETGRICPTIVPGSRARWRRSEAKRRESSDPKG